MIYWAQLILGLWILISPWVLGLVSSPVKWSNVIVGTIIVLISMRNLFEEK